MDRQHIREHQITERYLSGTLSPAEEKEFETAYLADPELQEELDLAENIRAAFKDFGAAGSPKLAAPKPARWLGFMSSPRYALAASLVAAAALVSTGALYLQNQGLRGGAGQTFAAEGQTRLLPLVSVRGAGNPNEIAAPAPGELTVLLLDPGFGDYDVYRAVLARRDGTEVLRREGLIPTYEGLLALSVPGATLAPGAYEIRLAGGRRDWPATRELDELSRTPLTVAERQ
jgi:hypothetical protein